MILDLIKFESLYQRKQRALLLLSLVFLSYGLLIGSMGHAPANVNFNSGYQLHFYTGLMTLGGVFIVMFFAISGVIRDRKHTMESILYSTPISKWQYFLSRLVGVYTFSLLTFAAFLIGHVAGTFSPSLDPSRVMPFNFLDYLQTWVIFVMPNMFICVALVFSVALLTKNNLATYASGIFIYMLYMVSSMVLNSPLMAASVPATPDGLMMAALADPFGLAAFFEQTQFWTAYQKNNEVLSFTGLLFLNRLLWMCIAILCLVVAYRAFSFRRPGEKKEKKNDERSENVMVRPYESAHLSFNHFFQWSALRFLVISNLKGVFKSLPFVGVMLVWSVIEFSEIYFRVVEGGDYHDSLYATTSQLIDLLSRPLGILALILIVFYCGEIVWRNREFKFEGVIDATPVSNTIFFLSNLISVLALPFILISSGILICVLFQWYTGYYNFEWDLYLLMFYYQGSSLLFYGLLTLFIQSVLPNKYVAMGLSGLLILMLGTFSTYIGIEYPMFRLGINPIPKYTEMNGYSVQVAAFHDYTVYWWALGGLLALLSFRWLQRGVISDIKFKYANILHGWTRKQRLTLVMFAFAFLTSAFKIYYNTSVEGEYISSTENLDIKEHYEREYKHYDSLDRLSYVDVYTEVDLYPSENRYTIYGQHILRNNNKQALSEVFINERIPLTSLALGEGKLIIRDTICGAYLFEFDPAIQPGQDLVMTYSLERISSPYRVDHAIVNNGTYVSFRDYEPKLGYNSSMEIYDDFERKKRKLPKRESEDDTESHLLKTDTKVSKTSFETIISTESDQTAISTGQLIEQWEDQGRKYFHYKAAFNVLPTIAYLSAGYEVRKSNFNNIAIEQYYHRGHEYNLDKIEESTKQTLKYCTEHFGDYPFGHVRIAEIPAYRSFGGMAMPGVISMVEDRLYLVDIRDTRGFDLVSKRTIHEVAHQWWGMILTPRIVEGGSIFVEGFAKYTEAVVMEKMYGKGATWQISETANHSYFKGRAFASEPEPPIYLEGGENYLAYGKHFTVMMAIRDLIGEGKLNQVLKTITERYRKKDELLVTSLDLMEELYKVTPQQYHSLVDDWFKRVITYNLSVKDASVTPLENGQFKVDIDVATSRFKTDEDGEPRPVSINEPIMVGIFTKHPKEITEEQSVLYMKPHRVNSNELHLSIIVDNAPTHVAIDPYGTRSDENLFDNVEEL
ncbi:ABC transporter permease subunit [Fulvivirga sp. 29W222]|uniref:ABC transporter permease subunit n=1 Tax=Fulvivirga marina TaxID=2494733 RepID=A0A937G1H2_9BACT|nr:M1 family aminopeptidase [Fulvivirga marina]MBL6448842.1 ABC transporter permease subunit [Fulvivirga marina]